jgi:hypothetical protein
VVGTLVGKVEGQGIVGSGEGGSVGLSVVGMVVG